MATLADIRLQVQRDLRDTISQTWTSAELNDMINQGFDALADFYPREVADYSITISSGTFTYVPAVTFTNIYRVDIHSAADSYMGTLAPGIGERDSGWSWFGGVLWLPPNYQLQAGYKLRIWGYARYATLTGDSDSTDADTAGINAVRIFCQAEGFGRLMSDRASFQQWQGAPGNTDVAAISLMSFYRNSRFRWREEQQRLRRLRRKA